MRHHFGALCKIAFYQTFLVFALVYTAMSRVPGAVGAIIIGSSPLTTAVVAHFLADDDHMSSGKTAGLLMGVSGVVVLAVSRNPLTPTGFYESIGILLLVTATIVSAYGNILVSRHQTGIDPIGLNAAQLFLGGVFLFLFSIPLEGFPPLHRFPPEYFGALVWLAAVSAFALSLWFYLLQQPGVKVSDLNFWKFLVPVSGALLSWAVLPEESPAPAQVAGMVLIAFSIIIHNRVQAHHRKTTAKQKIVAAAPKT